MWTDEEVWCVLFCSLDFFGKTWLYFSGRMFGQITFFRNVTVETPSPVFLATEILHNFGKVCKSTEILMQAFHSFVFKVWSIRMNQSGIRRFVSVVFSYITFSSSPDRLFCCYFADNLPLPKFSSTKWLWVCHVALVFYFIYRICSADRSLSWFKQFSSIFLTRQTKSSMMMCCFRFDLLH